MTEIAVLGLSHRSAPVELRERVAFQEGKLPTALSAVREELKLPECVILSTCNRVELYTLIPERDGHEAKLKGFLSRFHRLEPESLDSGFYWHLQPDSVRHLFRVAAGLDSMVVGESEILGQVRDAYTQAVSHGSVGAVFHRLFQTAIRAGKAVRSRTKIGEGAVSVSSVGVELARRIFRDLPSKTILVLGAGQIAKSTLACLKAQGTRKILVANRTQEAAVPLAESVGGQVVPFTDLSASVTQADIVICSTAADRYLLTRPQIQAIMSARRQRPLFLIDISVPRNLDPQIGQLENVYLYDIDDLEGISSSNLQMRLGEMEACSEIVEREMNGFLNRFNGS
ncbi:MAG: glutamyl-tRNA reductase [Candidatus Omnitrophota bacterium]|nr:glutamyl-tRNA reductase [Candidatus Omnitrophota bacterium]